MADTPNPTDPASQMEPFTPFEAQPKKRARSPREFTVKNDVPVQLWSAWDVPRVSQALDAHILGNFWNSGLLCDAMVGDETVDATLTTRVNGLFSRETTVKRATKANGTRARQCAADIAENEGRILPSAAMKQLHSCAVMMGFALAQLIWNFEDDTWLPALQFWHPSLVYYRIDVRQYFALSTSGPVQVSPGDGQWFLYTPDGHYRGWVHAGVRACAEPWLSRRYAQRDWNRYNEVHGMPIKVGKVPSEADGADKQAFITSLSNLGNETAILAPQGLEGQSYGLDLVEATANTWEAFQGLINKCDSRIAIRLLGQNLTTEVEAGSLAAANVHDRVRLDYVRSDANGLAEAIREQIFKPFALYNYGDEDCAPSYEWNVAEREDKLQAAQAMQGVATAMVAMGQVYDRVDNRKLLDKAGVPLLAEDAEPNPPPLAPQQPTPPGGPAPAPPTARVSLATGFGKRPPTKGARSGQTYADAVADAGVSAAAQALAPTLDVVLDVVRKSRSYDEIRMRLRSAYADMSADAFAEIMESALTMANLAGRDAVAVDHGSVIEHDEA